MSNENIERAFGIVAQDVARYLRKTFDRQVQGLGLGQSEWWVLVHLSPEAGITQTALADKIDFEKAPLGRLLDKLQLNGLIERSPDPNDRRARQIYLTDKGRRMLEKMGDDAEYLCDMALADLTDDDRARIVEMLYGIKANLAAVNARGMAQSAPLSGSSLRDRQAKK